MVIEDFFIFCDKLSSRTFQAHPLNLPTIMHDNIPVEDTLLLMGDYSKFKFPIIFKQEYGKRLDDVIRTGYPSLYLISDKFKSFLENENFIGWQIFPVKIMDNKSNEITGYHGFSVTGRCGPVDWKKCGIVKRALFPNGPLKTYYKGLHIGLDQWDGSDFFIPKNYFAIIVTARVAKAFKGSKLTNIELRNLDEFETSDFALKILKKL